MPKPRANNFLSNTGIRVHRILGLLYFLSKKASRQRLPGPFVKVVNHELTDKFNRSNRQRWFDATSHKISNDRGGGRGKHSPGQSLEDASQAGFSVN